MTGSPSPESGPPAPALRLRFSSQEEKDAGEQLWSALAKTTAGLEIGKYLWCNIQLIKINNYSLIWLPASGRKNKYPSCSPTFSAFCPDYTSNSPFFYSFQESEKSEKSPVFAQHKVPTPHFNRKAQVLSAPTKATTTTAVGIISSNCSSVITCGHRANTSSCVLKKSRREKVIPYNNQLIGGEKRGSREEFLSGSFWKLRLLNWEVL